MKKIYLSILIVICLLILCLYSTYAMFTADLNIGEIIDLTASTLPTEGIVYEYKNVGIDAYETKTIDLNITNSTTSSLYYGVWYEMIDPSTINSNIKIGLLSTSANPATGQISSSQTKSVSLCIKNNTSSAIVLNIGVGYSNTNELNLPTSRSLITTTIDNEAPSLSLSKETYLDVPFDSTWTYNSATYDINGILNYDGPNRAIYATSPYLHVGGDLWYISFDSYVENAGQDSTYGRIYWDCSYFDSSYNSTTTSAGYSVNGNAFNNSVLNEWTTMARSSSIVRYGSNIEYIKLTFKNNSDAYSMPPIKIRNLTLHSYNSFNDFYLINISSTDNVGVTTTKYEKGIHSKEYFKEHGKTAGSNQIKVIENGTYTVYVEDAMGNSTIDTIEITNIRYTVKLNANGGSIPATNGWTGTGDSATKQFKAGETYGTLPTPTRTGYTFKGWNGKNKFNEEYYANLNNYNLSDSVYKVSTILLKKATTYKLSVILKNGFDGKNNGTLLINSQMDHIYNGKWSAIAHNTSGLHSLSNFLHTTNEEGYLYVGFGGSGNQEQLTTIIENTDVQLEEGTEATVYEPYYITTNTKVTQAKNHTLTAIWEENTNS